MRRLLILLTCVSCLGQQPADPVKERDLKVMNRDSATPPPGPSGLKTRPEVAPAKVSVPRGYAVIIGVGGYKNLAPESHLKYSESDAQAVERVLTSPQFGAFKPEDVHTLIGPRATLANIRKELETWLPSVAGPDDRVVVYFAGHGLVAGGRGFLAPYDVTLDDVTATAYPMAQLSQVLGKQVKSRRKVLFTDACHSGKITAESSDENIAARWKEQESPYFLILTATSERERSYEDPKLSTGFGIFTYFLVQGLQGNADRPPCDGVVTANELVTYLISEVNNYARERKAYQTPVALGDYDPELVMSVGSRCQTTSVSTTGTIVVQVNMDDVDVYVDDELKGRVNKSSPLRLPGLGPGVHTFRGVHKGYQPDTKQQMVIPGQEGSVQIRIQYATEVKRSALDLMDRGEKLLGTQRSSFDPTSLYMGRQRQTAASLQKALDLFAAASKEDPGCARCAFDSGQAATLLSKEADALAFFRKAIELDPSYVDARLEYAGKLIENGDPDEAIRQAREILRLEPNNDMAYSHMARAYLDKGVFDQSIESATRAITLKANNVEAYLWRGESARQLAYEQRKSIPKSEFQNRLSGARDDFSKFVSKTNFNNPVWEQAAFYFVGFGLGARSHADRKQSYAYQRSLAFLGLCSCEYLLDKSLKAIDDCNKAIQYDDKDPLAYYLLGNAYLYQFNLQPSRDPLTAARKNFARSVALNPDLDFSKNAKSYIESVDALLRNPRLQ